MDEMDVRVQVVDAVDEMQPRHKQSWEKVNTAVKGLEKGKVLELEYPKAEGKEEEAKLRRQLRMVVSGAMRRYHGAGKFHLRTSKGGTMLRAVLTGEKD